MSGHEDLERRLSRLDEADFDLPAPPPLRFDPDEVRAPRAASRPWWRRSVVLRLAPVAAALVLALVFVRAASDDPDPQRVQLAALPASPGASGEVELGDRVRVVLRGVRPSERSTYQVWLVPDDGAPRSVGTLEAGRDGRAEGSFARLDDEGEARSVAVTREPPGGSARPSRDAVLSGTLS